MMKNSDVITLGYLLEHWQEYGVKEAIEIDITNKTNSHILIAGMSGSGKTYAEQEIFARFVSANAECEVYFADYKQDDSFMYLRNCPRYFGYRKTVEALDIVYDRLQKRQAGEDNTKHPIMLVWDEYVANMLALLNEDKKHASVLMNKVAEILMLGRSLSIRIVTSCQRPDALVFPSGSRLNYGAVLILGAFNRSIYEMLMPDHIDRIEGKEFQRGEGTLLLQGAELHFVKIPTVQDENRMQELCIKALS